MIPEAFDSLGDFTLQLYSSMDLWYNNPEIKIAVAIFREKLNVIGGNLGNTNSPRGSSGRSSAIKSETFSGLFFIEISTFSAFLKAIIHPIKKCKKVLSGPLSRLSGAYRYGMKSGKNSLKKSHN